MKKILLIFFVFFLINVAYALRIENFNPDPIQLVYGEKNFTFLLNPENQNVSNINAFCNTTFECSVSCPGSLQANKSEQCNGTLKVPQYTYAGIYDGIVNVKGETNIGEVNANKTFTIFVEPSPNLVVNFDVKDITSNSQEEFFVNVRNLGNIDLMINIEGYVKKNESVVNEINISLNETYFYLKPNQLKVVKANITARNARIGEYMAVIKINAKNESWNFDFNYTKEDRFNVIFAYCDVNSTNNYLNIEITNKDQIEGKKFYPYDNLKLKVKVTNNNDDYHYVVIEAALVGEGIIEDTEVRKRIKINKDSYETIELNIQIPLLEEDKYFVYVKAYDEDNDIECVQDNTYINLTRPTREVRLRNVVTDKNYYQCKDFMLVSGSVVNIGKKDQELVRVIYKDDLENERKIEFSLDVDEEKNFLFNVEIPKNATEGMHEFWIYVYYNYDNYSNSFDNFFTSLYSFNISGNCIKPEKNGEITIDLPSLMYINNSYDGFVVIKNTGDVITVYQLNITAEWAQISLETSLVSLQPQEEKRISIKVVPLKTGINSVIAKIIFDGKEKVATKEIEVKRFGEEEYRKAGWLDELIFELERRPWLFAIAIISIIISIICIIILVIILLKKK